MPKVGRKIKRYVFVEDRDLSKEEQPVFLIKVAPKKETLDLLERLESTTLEVEGERNSERVRKFLDVATTIFDDFVLGWENWKTEDGEMIAFEKGKEGNWDWLNFQQISELLTAIQEANGMTGEEEKN